MPKRYGTNKCGNKQQRQRESQPQRTKTEEKTRPASKQAQKRGIELSHLQSNAEHLLIEAIHEAYKKIDFIIINPAAFTHTSVALRDALLSVGIPFIEVHLSNVHAREKFRHHSYLSDIATGVICGLGANGYDYALKSAEAWLQKNK